VIHPEHVERRLAVVVPRGLQRRIALGADQPVIVVLQCLPSSLERLTRMSKSLEKVMVSGFSGSPTTDSESLMSM
jgi:hypothetical protein